MKPGQTFRSTLKSNSLVAYQYELQVYRDYWTREESELPPPTALSDNQSEGSSEASELANDIFRDELDHDELIEGYKPNSRFMDAMAFEILIEDAMIPKALPSGGERIKSIQRVMATFTAQVVLSSVVAAWLLNQDICGSVYLRLLATAVLIVMTLAFNKHSISLTPCLIIMCYGVFSACLPLSLTLVACLIGDVFLSNFLTQLSALSLGLCLYAWTTKYEEWSQKAELFFAVASTVFASLVMTMVFSASPLAVMLSGTSTLLLGVVICDCAKDNIVPANTLDELFSDLVAIHYNIVTRTPIFFKLKARRLARKANWF